MSFILDALRKSDARRKQSDTPGLNSPEPSGPRRRRRRVLPIVVALGLVAVVATAGVYLMRPGWLGQRTAEENATAPTSESVSDQASEEQGGGASAGNRRSEGAADPERVDAEQRDRSSQSRVAQGAGDEESADPDETAEQQSTPESSNRRQPITPNVDRTVRRSPRQRESEPVRADSGAAARELERRMAEQQARQRRRDTQSSQAAEASTQAPQQQNRSQGESSRGERRRRAESTRRERNATESAEPTPLNDGVSEYVRAWQLPLAVRRNLPDLDLSIHVFSPEASERFVLINGERYTMGDTVGNVEIVDIRREGAVVDYQSHRFLLEPR